MSEFNFPDGFSLEDIKASIIQATVEYKSSESTEKRRIDWKKSSFKIQIGEDERIVPAKRIVLILDQRGFKPSQIQALFTEKGFDANVTVITACISNSKTTGRQANRPAEGKAHRRKRPYRRQGGPTPAREEPDQFAINENASTTIKLILRQKHDLTDEEFFRLPSFDHLSKIIHAIRQSVFRFHATIFLGKDDPSEEPRQFPPFFRDLPEKQKHDWIASILAEPSRSLVPSTAAAGEQLMSQWLILCDVTRWLAKIKGWGGEAQPSVPQKSLGYHYQDMLEEIILARQSLRTSDLFMGEVMRRIDNPAIAFDIAQISMDGFVEPTRPAEQQEVDSQYHFAFAS